MITPLNYPKIELKLRQKEKGIYVWCAFRKRELLLTPEEWVRQHILHFLVAYKSVPLPLIASEYALEINQLKRRCDGVVFDRKGKATAVIECKAPEIKLTEAIFHQIAQYNFKLKVEWLIMSNGIETIIANVNQSTGEIQYLNEIPDYSIMIDK